MSPTPLERLGLFFSTLPTRQGVLARTALGTAPAADAGLRDELARRLADDRKPDGTVSGGAVPTIWRAHELLDLGRTASDPTLASLLAWLAGRQSQPGAYGEGCDKARHAQRVCAHFVRGFYSPAPSEIRVAPITLPNGKAFRVEQSARFAVSCLALRAALRAGLGEDPGVRLHLESLRLLADQWTVWTGFFAPDAIVAGLHALALGGPTEQPTVARIVSLVIRHQSPEGGWPNADPFATIEALQATGIEPARVAVTRALPPVVERQRVDGSFGAMAQQERALIVLRAMLWADRAR